ncbi:MAG: hypothetical protein AAGK00_09375 [Pseudomonadota bacterium]
MTTGRTPGLPSRPNGRVTAPDAVSLGASEPRQCNGRCEECRAARSFDFFADGDKSDE